MGKRNTLAECLDLEATGIGKRMRILYSNTEWKVLYVNRLHGSEIIQCVCLCVYDNRNVNTQRKRHVHIHAHTHTSNSRA